MLFIADARVVYYSRYGVAYLDPELGNYYFSLLPAYYYAQRQRYPAHVTFLRKDLEPPPNSVHWGKYQNRRVAVMYDGQIKRGGNYFFLDAWSEELCDIREELGYARYRKGWDRLHITIGNVKEKV